MTEQITFAALAIMLVGSALAVVLSKNLFHAVLWLALALTGTAEPNATVRINGRPNGRSSFRRR